MVRFLGFKRMNSRMKKNDALAVVFALATIESVSATPLPGRDPVSVAIFAGDAAIDGRGGMVNARIGAIDDVPGRAWSGSTGGMDPSMDIVNGIAMTRVADADADAEPAQAEVGEPATILLLGAGIGMIACFSRRR
jgi:hypothetical protein